MTPILLFAAAILVRILSWHSVFQKDGIYPNGNDAYYHLRRIGYSVEHFPRALDFDPLINFPNGAQPIWPATFDWLIAALVLLLPGSGDPADVARIAVWVPPILGASTVVLAYLIGSRFFSRRTGIIAGLLLAILPAHAIYSRLGVVDHHVMVAFVLAIMLWFAMSLFREDETHGSNVAGGADAEEGPLRLGRSLGLGASMAAAVLVWPGSLLQVGLLQLALVIRLLTAPDSQSAWRWASRFALVHVVACLCVAPFSAGKEWQLWGSISPVVLSNFQPLYFFAGFATFSVLAGLWKRGFANSSALARGISAAAVGAVLLGGMFWAYPDLVASIADALAWFSKDEAFQAVVNESAPLFGGSVASVRATSFLGWFVYAVPVLFVWVAWRFRDRPEVLLLSGWGAALFLATLVQWRFMNSFAIAHCLVIGIACDEAARAMAGRLSSPLRYRIAATAGAVLLFVAILPSVRSYGLHVDNFRRSLGGEATVPVGKQRHARFVAEAARYLRDHSPPPSASLSLGEPAPDDYSVLGPWGDGHILKYFSGRAVVQDNFGDDAAPENFHRAEDYFAATSEADALAVVEPLRTRYVLVRSTGSGHSEGYAPDSMFARLYAAKGAARGAMRGRWGRRLGAVEALERHRMIYRSANLDPRKPNPYCMLFEIVSGAEIVGRAEPGTLVEARVEIEPREGPAFVYSVEAEADESGAYSLRVPYSNSFAGPSVSTGDHYLVVVAGESTSVVVSESAVVEGDRIEGPSAIE